MRKHALTPPSEERTLDSLSLGSFLHVFVGREVSRKLDAIAMGDSQGLRLDASDLNVRQSGLGVRQSGVGQNRIPAERETEMGDIV